MFGNFPDFKVSLGLGAIPADSQRLDGRWHSRWAQIVEEYTSRNLTFASDKVPALSGIARANQNATGKSYFVGNWQEDFLNDLAWRIQEPGIRDTPSCQPSWSWTKTNIKVEFVSNISKDGRSAFASIVALRGQVNDSLNHFDNIVGA